MDHNALLFSPRLQFSGKLSLDFLQTDEGRECIDKVNRKFKIQHKPIVSLSDTIESSYLQTEEETEYFLNVENVKQAFSASGNHLYDFIMQYTFTKEVSFGERVTLFCRMVSIYENELIFTDKYGRKEDIEFAIIYPK